jgi:hypothetical protein
MRRQPARRDLGHGLLDLGVRSQGSVRPFPPDAGWPARMERRTLAPEPLAQRTLRGRGNGIEPPERTATQAADDPPKTAGDPSGE